jgi:hypothetical protein
VAQQQPGTGRVPGPASPEDGPAGDPVWRRSLPWQQRPLGDAGERDTGADSDSDGDTGSDTGATRTPPPAGIALLSTGTPDDDRFEPDTRSSLGGRLTKHLLAGAVGLSLLVLVLPVLLLDESRTPHRSEADGPDRDFTLDRPSAPAGPEATPGPGRSPGATATPRATPTDDSRPTPAPGGGTVPVRLAAPRTAPTPAATPESTAGPTTPARRATAAVVRGTSVLDPGQAWTGGQTVLDFQSDGNLVLRTARGDTRWESGTAGEGAKTVFQADGNLVVYTTDMRTAWSSRTDGHDGAVLVLEADGHATVRHAGAVLWTTRTGG